MIKLYRARSLLYRRQILQENIRWKALDEIYKIYMLFHRSDLNISEKNSSTIFAFSSYALLSPELLNEKSSNQLHFMPAALICNSAARSRLNDIYPLRVIFSAKPTARTTT